MEFNEFRERQNRMCGTLTGMECYLCAFQSVYSKYSDKELDSDTCLNLIFRHYNECVEALIEWEKENGFIRRTNREIFIENNNEMPWQDRNEEGNARCGYPSCIALIPCADCGWWEEPENATEAEKIYSDKATEELSQYKSIVLDSEMSEILKDELIKAIDGNVTMEIEPDVIVRKPNGETKGYVVNNLGEHTEFYQEEKEQK